MPLFKLSPKVWKWTLSIILLATLLSMITELMSAWNVLHAGEHGSLGVTLEDQAALGPAGQNSNKLHIVNLLDTSPLRAANAHEGDTLIFVRPIDRWRKFRKDEIIPVILVQEGVARDVAVAPVAVSILESERIEYICRIVLSLLSLASALFVGLMGASDSANRRLAMTFVALGFSAYFNFNYSAGTLVFYFSKLTYLATSVLIWFGAASFCVMYRNQAIATTGTAFKPTFTNDPITFLFRVYAVLAGVVFLYNVWFGLGYETPGLWELNVVSILLGFITIVSSLYDGSKRTKGEIRERHFWILGSISIFAIPAIFAWFPQFEWAILLSYAGQFLMYVGMIYSVMKYKVLNFGFAMSRTLILSVITLLMYTLLEAVKYLVEKYMNGTAEIDRRELAFALVLFLAFHLLHNHLKDFLERWLLRRWYNREQRLRKFAKDAANFTSIDVLLVALVSALDKFTDGEKSAIYLLESDGTYKLRAGSVEFGPSIVPSDDGVLVALQSEMPVLDMSALNEASLQSVLKYELAIPMTHRGQLNGFVVLGAINHGSSYRPDQVAVLRVVIQQISLTLFALKVTVLESELLQLQKQAVKDNIALQLMSGRRKALREEPN